MFKFYLSYDQNSIIPKTIYLGFWMVMIKNISIIIFNVSEWTNAGGVTSMPSFLKEFFPQIYEWIQAPKNESNYCKYDNQMLQLFTSSLYIAALVASMIASPVTRKLGRKLTMLLAGIFFIAGTALSALAGTLSLIILGRIILGCGVGFANQVIIYWNDDLLIQIYY